MDKNWGKCPECDSEIEFKDAHIHGTSYHYSCGLWIVCKQDKIVHRIIDSCRCKDRQITSLKARLAALEKPMKELRLPMVLSGFKRQWVKCKSCGYVAYYDYVPFSLANPVMTLPCGHGIAERFYEAVEDISEEEAMACLIQQYTA